MRFLIVGYGFVGKATEYLLQRVVDKENIFIQDPALGMLCEETDFDYTFLCVPTPNKGRELDISLLQQVFNEYKEKNTGDIIIRSTIGPDQVDLFEGAIIMPEFLRERSWKEDVDSTTLPFIIGCVGGSYNVNKMYEFVSMFDLLKIVTMLTPKEASFFKLARNSALAMRVALANEYKEMCDRMEIDYKEIEKLLQLDPWTGGTHWQAPGPDGMPGFGGTCFPKDLTHMASMCYNTYNILETALEQNTIRRCNYELTRQATKKLDD